MEIYFTLQQEDRYWLLSHFPVNEIVFYLLWSNSDGLYTQNICEVPTKK